MKSISKTFTLVLLGILLSLSAFAQLTVYPGDANDNGKVDNIDVLVVCSDLGKTGPARNDNGLVFQPTQVNEWATDSTELNNGYSDCDGNGTVTEVDIDIIDLHYGQSHQPFMPDSFPIGTPGQAPELYLLPTVDSIFPGLSFDLDVMLGTSMNPAQDVYGIAFSIRFDTLMITGDSILSNFNNGLFGNDAYVFTKLTGQSGASLDADDQLDVAIARKDQQPISGFGRIGTFTIVMEENVSGKKAPILNIELERVFLMNNTLNASPVIPIDFAQEIYVTRTREYIDHPAKIYPNPAKERLHVDVFNLKINDIKLYNALGQVVKHEALNRQSQHDIPLSDLNPGIYLLAIETNKGIIMRKIITN